MKKILFLWLIAVSAFGQTPAGQRILYGTKANIRAYPGLSRTFVVVPDPAVTGLRTQETFVLDESDTTSPESDSVIVATGGKRFKRVLPVSTVSLSSVDWNTGIDNKPSTFAPAAHNHTITGLTGYGAFAAAKQDTIGSGATNQVLSWGRVWRTPDKSWVGLNNVPNTDATNADNLGSGTIPTGRYGARTIPNTALAQSGATDGQVLKWSTALNRFVPKNDSLGGGPGSWGGLSGTLSSQTDLQSALDAKAAAARTITAGTGLTGGGTLAADRTISIANDGVTNTKLAPMAAGTIKGVAPGGSTTNPSDITMSSLPISTAQQTALNARVLTVANVAALKAITGVAGQIAHTSGYYSANDGGGNVYCWNASSTAAKDSGFVFQANGVSTGRWLAVNQTVANLLQFGAKADGSTNDTPYIANALSKQRHTIAPKAANPYLVSGTLDVYANITCENGAVFKVANSYVGTLFRIRNLKGLNIKDVHIDAEGTGIRTTGLLAAGLWNSVIEGFRFQANSADTSSIGLNMTSSDASYMPFGNFVNYVINPYIYRGKIGIKTYTTPGDSVDITQLNVVGGWIANQSYANLDLHNAYNFKINNVAFDVIRTGAYGLRTDNCHQGEMWVGEYNAGGGKIANISSNSNLIKIHTLQNVNISSVVDGDYYGGSSMGELRLFPSADADYQATISSNNRYGDPFTITGRFGSGTTETILEYGQNNGLKLKYFNGDNSVGSYGIGFNTGNGLVKTTSRKMTEGTAAPSTGTWAVGDYRENTAPSAGGYMGWVCVTAGTPGTWKGYGAIQP